MKIVIDMPEEVLNSIKTFKGKFICENGYDLIQGIKNGTPLPKGHTVIDAWALQEHLALVPMEDRTYREAVEIIDKFPPITGTDEGVE